MLREAKKDKCSGRSNKRGVGDKPLHPGMFFKTPKWEKWYEQKQPGGQEFGVFGDQ